MEKNINVWLPLICPLLGTWPGLQPRHVPWLGIELVNLWFASQCSIHWVTPVRAKYIMLPLLFIKLALFIFYISFCTLDGLNYSFSCYYLYVNLLHIQLHLLCTYNAIFGLSALNNINWLWLVFMWQSMTLFLLCLSLNIKKNFTLK